MSKRSVFTWITPLPAGTSREFIVNELHNHQMMIDLSPLVIDRFRVKPPAFAAPDEMRCVWYQIEEQISYLPGVKGKVSFHACFHDLADGLQTHVYAPMGLQIRTIWSVGGTLPGEPAEPVELGLNVPKQGLYLREDVNVKSLVGTTGVVKKNLTEAHKKVAALLVERSQLQANRQADAAHALSPYASSGTGSRVGTPRSSNTHLSAAVEGRRPPANTDSYHGGTSQAYGEPTPQAPLAMRGEPANPDRRAALPVAAVELEG